MNNKNFENKLKGICTDNISIPQKFTHTIKNSLYKDNSSWGFLEMKKIAISVLCIAFIGTGIVLASNLLEKSWSGNEGVETALEYEYIQNVEMDYDVQNDLGIKIDSILIDNSNVGIVFNYKCKLKNIDNIVINDISIKDENNNIIFEDGNLNSLSTGCRNEVANERDILKQALLLGNSNHTYPQSNAIKVSFSTVSLFRNQENIKTITGNWNFNINVIDKFVNRETIKYIASQNKDVEIINAELTPTGLDVELKFDSLSNAGNLVKKENMKIQDKDGKEYFGIGTLHVEDELTKPTIKTSFSITTFNAQDNLKLIIKTDKEIIIDLNKVK